MCVCVCVVCCVVLCCVCACVCARACVFEDHTVRSSYPLASHADVWQVGITITGVGTDIAGSTASNGTAGSRARLC